MLNQDLMEKRIMEQLRIKASRKRFWEFWYSPGIYSTAYRHSSEQTHDMLALLERMTEVGNG